METFKFSAVVFTADLRFHWLPEVGDVWFALDFASLRLPKNPVAVDFDHDPKEPIGTALINIEQTEIKAVGELVSATPNDRAASIAASGSAIPYGISPTLDLSAAEYIEVADGATILANGRSYSGPFVLVKNAALLGISVVLYPTDPQTSFTPTTFKKERLFFMASKIELGAESAPKKTAAAAVPAEPEKTVKSAELQSFIETFGLDRGVRFFQEGKSIDGARAEAFEELAKENAQLKAQLVELEAAAKAAEAPAPDPAAEPEHAKTAEGFSKLFDSFCERLDATLAKLSAEAEKVAELRRRGDLVGLSGSVPAGAAELEKSKTYRDAFCDSLKKGEQK